MMMIDRFKKLKSISVSTNSGLVDRIIRQQSKLADLDADQLIRESRRLEFTVRSGQSLSQLIPDAFALVRQATKLVRGIEHYPVQLTAGAALVDRKIVEMDTGEGKTLTALLPLFLFSLRGRGAMLATANDYLAGRDARDAQQILKLLGKSVGAVTAESTDSGRRKAYQCDITFGTANEFGFDLLRDRGKRRAGENGQCVSRGDLHAIIVDEADSLLIDEATTPLVIASPAPQIRDDVWAAYQWADQHATKATEKQEFVFDHRQEKIELTAKGYRWARSLPLPTTLRKMSPVDSIEFLERAIKVHRNFQNGQHYVVHNGEVLLVDENTGRFGHGRQWQDGIQQAIQAKEGLDPTMPNGQMGRVTLQTFFLAFEHCSGMSGTARQAAGEFKKIYRMSYLRVQPHRKNLRERWPDRFFSSEEEKYAAIAEEVSQVIKAGRCVLVGTRSIESSNRLCYVFDRAGINYRLLNASQSSEEADIIAQAGQAGNVTIATSMAGRGTDIELSDEARKSGGLHVILSELHDSARIDRQLVGRCARQGDPGSFRRFLAGDDLILKIAIGLVPNAGNTLKAVRSVSGLVSAQQMVEQRRRIQRKSLFDQEKKRIKQLSQSGFDPLLDYIG